jgi:hypothetical protein
MDAITNEAKEMEAFLKPLPRVAPPPAPDRGDCIFYHCLDLPDGESVSGNWDIRGGFEQYVGVVSVNVV